MEEKKTVEDTCPRCEGRKYILSPDLMICDECEGKGTIILTAIGKFI